MALSHEHLGSKISAKTKSILSAEPNYFVLFAMRYPLKGNGGKNVIRYKIPPNHEVMVSKTKQRWHLPLPPQKNPSFYGGKKFTRNTHLIPDKYLCLSLKSIKDVKTKQKRK